MQFVKPTCRLEPLPIPLLLPPSTPILDFTTSYLEVHTNTVLFKTGNNNNNKNKNNNFRSVSVPTNLPVPASPEHQPRRPLQPIPCLSLCPPQLWSRYIWFG